jgi:hypothetical protein
MPITQDDVLNKLLEFGVFEEGSECHELYSSNIAAQDADGETMVHYIARSGNVEALNWMLVNAEGLRGLGVDIAAQDADGETMVHYIARSGNVEALNWMLVNAEGLRGLGVDIAAKDKLFKATFVHSIARSGKVAVLDWMLAKAEGLKSLGVDIAAKDKLFKATFVHSIARSGKVAVLDWMLAKAEGLKSLGVDIAAKDKFKSTLVHHIAIRGKVNAVMWALEKWEPLKKAGVDITNDTKEFDNCFTTAIKMIKENKGGDKLIDSLIQFMKEASSSLRTGELRKAREIKRQLSKKGFVIPEGCNAFRSWLGKRVKIEGSYSSQQPPSDSSDKLETPIVPPPGDGCPRQEQQQQLSQQLPAKILDVQRDGARPYRRLGSR